jgi:glycosyltransferase involved in cell wall biosynthesis
LAHIHFEYSVFGIVKPLRNRFATLMNRLRQPALVTLHGQIPRLEPRWRSSDRYGLADLARDTAYLPFFPGWEAHQYQRARRWLVYTPELYERASRHAGPGRVTLQPLPVPTPTHEWRLEHTEASTLATLGFIKFHKGYDQFVDVLAAAPQWHWSILGGAQTHADEDVVADLLAAVDRRGLRERVAVSGYLARDEAEARAVRARLAVFPLRSSLGSASIAWAIGLGMPIVATDLALVRWLRQNGAGVELLPSRRDRWASTIEELLVCDDRLDELACRNRRFRERFSMAASARKLVEIACEVAGFDRAREPGS